MRIALVADAYPPLRTSCAVQMKDLAKEFALQGHEVTVLDLLFNCGKDAPRYMRLAR